MGLGRVSYWNNEVENIKKDVIITNTQVKWNCDDSATEDIEAHYPHWYSNIP